jgi:hypothetical protein
MIVEKRQLVRGMHSELVPDVFDRGVRHAVVEFIKDNASEFAILKAVVETFEIPQFLHHLVGHATTTASGNHLHGARNEPEHALLLKTAFEVAKRLGMHPGFPSSLGGALIADDHHGADEFIAFLSGVVKRQSWVVRIRKGQHFEASVRVCWDMKSQAVRVEWPKANRTGTGSGLVPQLRPPFRL